MSQINPPSGQLAVDPGSDPEPCQMISEAMPQARGDFDAALRRAGQDKTDDDDDQSDELDQSDQMCPNLAVLASMPPGTTASQVTSSDAVLGGGGIMAVVPNAYCGTLPDSAPITASATNAADQQWHINIPGNDPSSSAMAVRLLNSGTGHWQVRLAADSATRLQLTPGLGRLRDKLRQNSGNRIDDLEFDDDIDSESETDTQP